MKGRLNMKKLISFILAASVAAAGMSSVCAAEKTNTYTFEKQGEKVAVVAFYDSADTLVYSVPVKSETGVFTFEVPEKYKGMKTKTYMALSNTFENVTFKISDETVSSPIPTAAPVPTATPEAISSPKPTAKPNTASKYPSIYEKEADALYVPAVVKSVSAGLGDNGADNFIVTVLMRGREVDVPVEATLEISTAPEAFSEMEGQNAEALKEGDVVCFTANIAGDRIKRINLLFRPTEEDIVTGSEDYGENFEKLFSEGGFVAGKWDVMKYGVRPSSERYQYAFGVIGKKSGSELTLINKSGDIDNAIDIDIKDDTIVYRCDMGARELVPEIADTGSISTTISSSALNKGPVDMNNDYEYNYALVRVVDDTATEIIIYENYDN